MSFIGLLNLNQLINKVVLCTKSRRSRSRQGLMNCAWTKAPNSITVLLGF